MRKVRLRRWVYRISAAKKWNPVHPSQRFNFPRDNGRTAYLGQDLAVCRAEVLGKTGGLVPIKLSWSKARVDLVVWDLRKPGRELGGALGRLVRERRHSWAVKMVATRARRDGIEGILYSSVRERTKWCLVLFEENVKPRQFRKFPWKALP